MATAGIAKDSRRFAARISVILAGAAMLCWPAFWNHLPLIFPDDTEYLVAGNQIMRILYGTPDPLFAEGRSEFYSIALHFIDCGTTLWPIVAWQALILSWVLWLVVRSIIATRTVMNFFSLVAALSILTSVGWYVSYVMPDIWGPILYLGLYLLIFAFESLTLWERGAVASITCWSVTTHSTHLVLTAALCCLLFVLWLVRWQGMQKRQRALLLTVGVLLLAPAAQIRLHKRLYGKRTLIVNSAPFLMARALADGPARTYLQRNCKSLNWTICKHVKELPDSDSAFLWQPGGIWQSSSTDEKKQLVEEQMPLVWATLRAYPFDQAIASLRNFEQQLITIGPGNFGDFAYTDSELETMMPGLAKLYRQSLQSHEAMPQTFCRKLQEKVILVSLIPIVLVLPALWRHRTQRSLRLLGLSVIVLFVVPANALLTGVASGAYARYQGRVVWLLALLAMLLVYGRFHLNEADGQNS